MEKPKPKILGTKPAGEDHQVVTILGGDKQYCTKPCATCPWRKDATGEFPAEAFRHSANTAYDMAEHTFACHQAGIEKPTTCAGFLLNGSMHNMTVRIGIITDVIDLNMVSDGGHELHENYRAMAIANGVDPNDPVLAPCRD